MNSVDLIKRLHQHRYWVNHKLIATAEALSDEQLRQTFAIGQGSVWKTLVHLFGAEFVWCEALSGNPEGVAPGDIAGKLPGNQLGERPIASVAELKEHWVAAEARWVKILAAMSEADLDAPAFRKNSLTGQMAGTRCADVLLHLNLHAQYTTAQANNMFRQLGVAALPDPMMISMARAENPQS
jgi:uncharacterized damage-inducible protein DinB